MLEDEVVFEEENVLEDEGVLEGEVGIVNEEEGVFEGESVHVDEGYQSTLDCTTCKKSLVKLEESYKQQIP